MGRRVGTVAKADLPVVLLTIHPAVYGVTSRWFGPGSRQVIPASGSLAVQSVRSGQVTLQTESVGWGRMIFEQ